MVGPEKLLFAGGDCRMAGEDLFDQGCPGARHTDDQQWRLVLQSEASMGCEEIAGVTPDQPVDNFHKPGPVEWCVPASDAVSDVEMTDCFPIFAEIVEQLTDGEMQE